MKKVILDCDNTIGVKRSDIDDGLTFAYLYANPDIDLLGITCTFANNHEHVCYYNTIQMMEDLEITDVPVLKGGRNPEEYNSDAVDFLVKSANEAPGEITVIAIGSLCNIAGAYTKDPLFFQKIQKLIVMGGILEPLYLNGVANPELNFSVDYKSAVKVLYHCSCLTVMSAQCTKEAVYGEEDVKMLLAQNTRFMNRYVTVIRDWIAHITHRYGNRPIFINWDLCCAIYLTHPELFQDNLRRIVAKEENMKTGWMQEDKACEYPDNEVVSINIPDKILNLDAFNKEFYTMMKRMK